MVGTTKGTISSRPVGSTLRQARQAKKLSVRELAARLGTNHSVVSRVENGYTQPTRELLARIYAALDMTDSEIGELLADIRSDSTQWIGTGQINRNVQIQALRAFEGQATSIVSVLPTLIPGWFQIPSYTQAIMHAGGLPEWEVQERVKTRADRAQILIRRRNPTALSAYIGEMALRQVVGGPEVMHEQLLELLDWADPSRPHIDIRIVPYSAGWFPGMGAGFMLLDFGDAQPSLVHTEDFNSGQFRHDPAEVAEYRKGVDTVRSVAMSQEESRRLIADIAQIYDPAGSEHVA